MRSFLLAGHTYTHFLSTQAVSQARGAAAKLYATIDRVPHIDAYSEAGGKLDTVHGDITLEGVKFAYPVRQLVRSNESKLTAFRLVRTSKLSRASTCTSRRGRQRRSLVLQGLGSRPPFR